MDRRNALGILAGSAATGIALKMDNPLRTYADATKTSLPRLKITDVKVIMTQVRGNHLTNVKVLTSEPGLYGVGCGTHAERPLIVAETIDKYLKPLAVGRYVDEIEQIWQTAWVAPYWRASVDANNAMSAIDGALWDIMGKRAGMPVYDLMGGKVREGSRMFANAGGRSLQDLEDNVRKSMEAGFEHVRINPVSANEGGRGGGGGRGGAPSEAVTDPGEGAVRTGPISAVWSRRWITCGKRSAGISSFATMFTSGQHRRVLCFSPKLSNSTARSSWKTCLLPKTVPGISAFASNRVLRSQWANFLSIKTNGCRWSRTAGSISSACIFQRQADSIWQERSRTVASSLACEAAGTAPQTFRPLGTW